MSGAASSAVAEFRRWRPLWCDLAADIHPGRWQAAGIAPATAARLTACRRVRNNLSVRLDWIAPDAPAWGPWETAPPEAHAGWALRPGGELWAAGLRLGAGRFRAEVARLVLRPDVAAVKEAVGEDAYGFALRQAALMWRDAVLEDDEDAGAPLVERMRRTAGLGLGCWLAGLPGGLAARARLKLPPDVDAAFATARGWPEERRRVWLAVLGRVLAFLPKSG